MTPKFDGFVKSNDGSRKLSAPAPVSWTLPPPKELTGTVGIAPDGVAKMAPPPKACPLKLASSGTPLLLRKMPAVYQPPIIRLIAPWRLLNQRFLPKGRS